MTADQQIQCVRVIAEVLGEKFPLAPELDRLNRLADCTPERVQEWNKIFGPDDFVQAALDTASYAAWCASYPHGQTLGRAQYAQIAREGRDRLMAHLNERLTVAMQAS